MILLRSILCPLLIVLGLVSTLNGQDEEDLTSSSVSEGPCDPNIRDYAVQNIQPVFSTEAFYMPIASEGCYRSYAEVLLGRPARSQEELDSMKLRIRVRVPPIFRSYGFPNARMSKYFRQTCLPTSFGSINQVLCLPLPIGDAPGTDTSGVNTSLDTIVYADSNGTSLVVRCLNDKVKDYKVLAYTPKLTPETIAKIEEKIVQVGFSKDLMRINDDY